VHTFFLIFSLFEDLHATQLLHSVVWCLSRADFRRVAITHAEQVLRDRFIFLRQVVALKSLSDAQIVSLCDALEEVHYSPTSVVTTMSALAPMSPGSESSDLPSRKLPTLANGGGGGGGGGSSSSMEARKHRRTPSAPLVDGGGGGGGKGSDKTQSGRNRKFVVVSNTRPTKRQLTLELDPGAADVSGRSVDGTDDGDAAFGGTSLSREHTSIEHSGDALAPASVSVSGSTCGQNEVTCGKADELLEFIKRIDDARRQQQSATLTVHPDGDGDGGGDADGEGCCMNGEVVFDEGDDGDSMYIIKSGVVRIYRRTDQSPGGGDDDKNGDNDKDGGGGGGGDDDDDDAFRVLKVCRSGDYFGELSLLMRTKRTAAAIAFSSDVVLLRLKHASLKMLLGPVSHQLYENATQYSDFDELSQRAPQQLGGIPESERSIDSRTRQSVAREVALDAQLIRAHSGMGAMQNHRSASPGSASAFGSVSPMPNFDDWIEPRESLWSSWLDTNLSAHASESPDRLDALSPRGTLDANTLSPDLTRRSSALQHFRRSSSLFQPVDRGSTFRSLSGASNGDSDVGGKGRINLQTPSVDTDDGDISLLPPTRSMSPRSGSGGDRDGSRGGGNQSQDASQRWKLVDRLMESSAAFLNAERQSLSRSHLRTPSARTPHPAVDVASLELVGVLGRGNFGHVQLMRIPKMATTTAAAAAAPSTFAVKVLDKQTLVDKGQASHACDEQRIQMLVVHPFIVSMRCMEQSADSLYFLFEPVLGGTLFTALNKRSQFAEKVTRFYAAQIVLVFEYLHSIDIIHRDTKPENLLIGNDGYLKLSDFGLAKELHFPARTFTSR
jgi:CRP-like cAMP-binding protein